MSPSPLPFADASAGAQAALRLAVAAPPGHYDELLATLPAGDRALRPAWQDFFDQLGAAGLRDLPRLDAQRQRQVHEHGITYNVYGDEHGAARRWSLDLLPFLVGPQDWRMLQAAIVQRAAVLSAIMQDVYGPGRLLHEGLLPPALVLGSPGYLRPLAGLRPPGGIFLHVVAFDLARGADGRWWVLGHRTQAPSGLGYALENRVIIARLLGENFAALRVQRLAASYRQLLETLLRHAPRVAGEGGGPPRIVLLTPGRYNETYFEHAYLAHYLGLALVEGADLTVREDCLYLKTLHGLERVHAVIRRLDDVFCDPLELRPDSALGVPGLLRAIRSGTVLVANALGAAFLESPAIHGFLPALARRLCDQELLLPPRDSWWCGEAAARARAFATLRVARVRATYRGMLPAPACGAATGLLELDGVRAAIEQQPDLYTVQSYLPYSKTPCWSGQALVPRSAVLRLYAVADGAGGWHVMPGGLTRIAERQDEVSMQRGGSSADTWVITGDAVDPYTMLQQNLPVDAVVACRRSVSSRAAENLFWLGRYTERADNAVRAALAILAALRHLPLLPQSVLLALTRTATALGLVPSATPAPLAGQTPGERVFERTLLAGLRDARANSIAFDLLGVASAAMQIRDRLAFEHWRQITDTVEAFMAAVAAPPAATAALAATVAPVCAWPAALPLALERAQAALLPLVAGIGAITAAQTDGMTRDDGWRLLTIGRQLERLICMSEVLQAYGVADSLSSAAAGAAPGTAGCALQHEAGFDQVLALFNSTVTYRARYQGQRALAALLDLLVLESANPRSLACAVELIGRELAALSLATGEELAWTAAARFAPPRALLLRQLLGRVDAAAADPQRGFPELLALTAALSHAARSLSNRVGLRYFSHSAPLHSQGGSSSDSASDSSIGAAISCAIS